ncbi:Protein YIPF5 [Amphibalanus amphitrite]|uniref:Protein YIPF5 n=2 Tax=Amphibalanus amphitrite TaxID=1232801 RepID=A0A6A4V2C7_AMPAM|nr:Protein YIPF5 [Amphibalanus amphitrite]
MNVEGVSPPTPFLARPGKPALPWSDWIFSFHNYLTALGGEAYSTERKTALLLHCVGAEAQRVYRTLPVQPRREDEDEFHAAERQLAEFYEPQVNVIAERFFFRQRRQESHEPTADYVAALRRLAVNCSFGQMTDAMIRDQVVEATVHPILRERFLQDKGLTLDRVLEIAEAFERSRREATAMAGPARPAADGAQYGQTLSALNPFRQTNAEILQDTDLAGPLAFCLAFGGFLLLTGKLHFGYIYGIGLMGCVAMYFLLNLMSMQGVSMGVVVSVLGYCLLPMVVLSGVSIVLSLQGALGMALAGLTILWCSLSASKLFVTALVMDHQQPLVGYPCALLYGVFALLTVF